jgi:hypothetical protein
MTLRLSNHQANALKKLADSEGLSMHEAALRAIDYYIARRHEHLLEAINRVVSEDKELLSRLAK